MTKLTGKVFKRSRISNTESYCYWINNTPKPGQIEHKIGVNWGYIWILNTIKEWEKLHSFEWEVDYGILRADGLASIKNVFTNDYRFHFIEFENTKKSLEDKVNRINIFFEEKRYINAWWSSLATGFPSIIVISEDINKIEKIIQKENRNNLNFIVCLYSEVKEDCLKWLR